MKRYTHEEKEKLFEFLKGVVVIAQMQEKIQKKREKNKKSCKKT